MSPGRVMLLPGHGPGGPRKESYCTTEQRSPSASWEMPTGASREGRAQIPIQAAVNGAERAEAHCVGSQGIILEPQVRSTMCCKGGHMGPLHRDGRNAQASQIAYEKTVRRVSLLLLEASVDSKGESRWASEQVRQGHPLLENNHRAAAGDHEDKSDSCKGLSDTLEEGLEWERLGQGGQHGTHLGERR